jgi:iron complex transport system permease protein
MTGSRHRAAWIVGLALPVLFVVALAVGRYGVSFSDALRALLGLSGVSDVLRSLVLRVRLPRVLAAMCVGANLAVSGAVFQGLFRNPLVDSRILGVSSGAAFGAAIALLFSGSMLSVQMSAFLFALVAVGLVCLIGWRFGSSTLVVIIGGVLVGALFNALLGLVKYVADPLSTLPAITYWLLGSLSGTRRRRLLGSTSAPFVLRSSLWGRC